MYYFTTLFDSLYLSRGLVMLESLQKHCKKFHLYIFAFDELCFDILKSLDLQNTTIISLKEFETTELLDIKPSRSKAEYCWTCTPSTIWHVLKTFKVPNCTYIDADLQFYSDPSVLIEEMNNAHKSVLITEHRFSKIPELYEKKRGGRFCVQFMTFLNEPASLAVLERWKDQCIEWCYARYEDGKFGDQKYLDVWPEIYKNVHILEHQGGGLAPWNADQYRFRMINNKLSGITKKNKLAFEPVFYHFQYVKFLSENRFDIGWYLLSQELVSNFYHPYLKRVVETEHMLNRHNSEYNTIFAGHPKDGNFKGLIKLIIKRFFKYNILKLS